MKLSKSKLTGLRVVATLLLVLGGSLVAWSQQITGSIVGTVKDQQGAVINTATVKATNVDTGFTRSAAVNGYGEFRIDYLPVGKYTVQAQAAGFQTHVQQNIALSVDQTQTVEITMAVGAQTQTVTVTEAPPLVETDTAELGRTVAQAEIVGLPLVNRNAYAELSLTPGVMANSASPQSNSAGTPNFVIGLPSTDVQINGSIDGGNPEVSFYLDGGLNINGIRNYGNQLPNPDALDEFRVETSDFSAQYGHMSAAVVTAVTKSGTNQFHGSLFEFNRNTDFNAIPWGQLKAQPYHRNNFGGVIGGPVKHDKAFFLFSYAALRMVVGTPLTGALVPTAAERLGDFTADSYKVYVPGTYSTTTKTGTQENGTNSAANCQVAKPNCIASADLDPTAANILNTAKLIPLPNTGTNGWVGYFTGPTDDNEYLAKYDQVARRQGSRGCHLLLHPDHAELIRKRAHRSRDINQSYTNQTNANLSDVHTFNANTANQAWLTYTRASGGRVNLPATDLGKFGSSFTIQGPSGLPDLNVSGFFNAGGVAGRPGHGLGLLLAPRHDHHDQGQADAHLRRRARARQGNVRRQPLQLRSFRLPERRTHHNHRQPIGGLSHRPGVQHGAGHPVPYARKRMAHGFLPPGQLPHHAPLDRQPWSPVGYRYASGRVVESDCGVCSQPAI